MMPSTPTMPEDKGDSSVDLRHLPRLRRWKKKDREGIVLRLEFGLGYEEIAKRLGNCKADAARMTVRTIAPVADKMDRRRS